MVRHRAAGWEYASRVNSAAELLRERGPAAAARALAGEHAISERQARRYVAAAAASGAVAVPEPTAPVTIRLPRSLLAAARSSAVMRGTSLGALVAEALRGQGEQQSRGQDRRGGQAR